MGQASSQAAVQGSSQAIEEGTVFLSPRKNPAFPPNPSQADALPGQTEEESIPLPPDDPFDVEHPHNLAEDKRRAAKRARRERKARTRPDLRETASFIYSQTPVILLPSSPITSYPEKMSHEFQGAPQAQMTSGPAVSHVREQGNIDYAIDPQLQESESAKQARLALESAEGGPLPAPPPGHGGAFVLETPYVAEHAGKSKKRGGGRKKKENAAADAPQEPRLDREPSPDLGAIQNHLRDQSEEQATETVVDPPADQDDDEDYVAATEEAVSETDGGATAARKRKRANGEAKPTKRAKKVAKRTDGATSREASPAGDSTMINLPDAGTFTKPELQILDDFMDRYCERTGMKQFQLNTLIHSKAKGNEEQINNFWDSVFDLLPQRKDRRSIRLTCRRRYHNYEERGRWTAEDDQALRNSYESKPNKWSAIGAEIGRMPEDCKDRWQNYVGCGDNRRTGDWTEKEEMQLSIAIEECKEETRQVLMDEAREQKKTFEERDDYISLISFKAVSEKMGHIRSGLQCRQHWKRMQKRDARIAYEIQNPSKKKKTWRDVQAVDNWNRMRPGDKYMLLSQVRDTDTQAEHNIPWKLITKDHPDSKWTTKDRKTAFEKMKSLIDPQQTLAETLAELMQYFEEHHPTELDSFYDGLVRSEETATRPAKATAGRSSNVDPSLADDGAESAPKRPKKAAKSRAKGKAKIDKHKSADMITASDDEVEPAARETEAEEIAEDDEPREQGLPVENRIQDHLPGFEPGSERNCIPESPQLPELPEDPEIRDSLPLIDTSKPVKKGKRKATSSLPANSKVKRARSKKATQSHEPAPDVEVPDEREVLAEPEVVDDDAPNIVENSD